MSRTRSVPSPLERHSVFSRRLLRWYRSNGRALPWRETRDPYRIWVSEVLLQQTQVSRGAEAYQRFLQKFPDVQKLAESNWAQLYPVWRGLGYYQRARNMLEAARLICHEHDGTFPESYDALRRLPGVGPYTANAILSFAFGQPVPALDTNLKRVIGRYFGAEPSAVAETASALFERRHRTAAELNHALMDLGALLCKFRNPHCDRCPVAEECAYRQAPPNETLDSAREREARTSGKPCVDVGVACINRGGKYLVGKRPARKGGLWEFPGGKREPGESIRQCLKREIWEELRVEVSVRPAFLVWEQEEADRIWRLHFCRCRIQRGQPRATEHTELRWLEPAAIAEIPFPEANSEAVDRLRKMK